MDTSPLGGEVPIVLLFPSPRALGCIFMLTLDSRVKTDHVFKIDEYQVWLHNFDHIICFDAQIERRTSA